MVKAWGILVCVLIIALDIAAGILALEADVKQNKAKHTRLWLFEYREPNQVAFKLGLAAATLLVAAHVLANFLGGCDCNCSHDELQVKAPLNCQLTVLCLIFTWIVLAAGLSMFVIGTMSSHKPRASCGFTHHHILGVGGILCFVHGLFSVAYYVSATAGAPF
ncbi:hypothetical protein SAY87_011645 [Trapa incisa]|uniref:Uncharacterized protein n=2 Tax=Trapa TaxID=22665 RepID=A0AAN7M1N8_TRANT|nr:hypothetical protein SAY87_011645 [Trapa incisa]KAK4795734.1 hypothetical protein SAY86_028060 [Trapa natans]